MLVSAGGEPLDGRDVMLSGIPLVESFWPAAVSAAAVLVCPDRSRQVVALQKLFVVSRLLMSSAVVACRWPAGKVPVKKGKVSARAISNQLAILILVSISPNSTRAAVAWPLDFLRWADPSALARGGSSGTSGRGFLPSSLIHCRVAWRRAANCRRLLSPLLYSFPLSLSFLGFPVSSSK